MKSREELSRATEEIEVAHTECLNVTKELEKLKTEYEQLRIHSKTAQEREIVLRELERQHITESKEEVINRLSSLLGSDTETLAALYRENSQMCAQYHLVVGEAEKSKRLYDTQMSELKNELIRAIEGLASAKTDRAALATKCESLSEEMESLAKGLTRAQTDLKAARQRIVDCERARLSSEKHHEGRVHCLRTELNNCRLVAQRERVEIERQRDQLAFQVQGSIFQHSPFLTLVNLQYFTERFLSDLANQMALSLAKFEETEALHQQRLQEMMQRESDLRKTIADSTEESRKRSVEMLHQLECTQSRLRELTAQHKDMTQVLAEVRTSAINDTSETLKSETQKKLSLSEAQNSALKDELSMVRHELTARQNQIQSLECALKEITSADDQLPEKQRMKLIEKISQLNAELAAKSYEAEQSRQENEKLR
ncbi:unnamed protein product [Taenia asiatica]|uniref:Nucleoprotein TPR n=1 Tax=Taenia asiatica TaxID=60517 RepID=A0A0R3W2N7_TAEAS|nr:unnamed protein product [Taenia asiatica]